MTSAGMRPFVDGDASLRMLVDADLPQTLAWRNHADSRYWFLSTDEISEDQHRAWFSRYLARSDDYVFIMEVDGRPLAQVSLYGIAAGEAEFGRLLVDPDERGRGLAHRATQLCLRVAAEELALHRLVLEVKGDNEPALRAYHRAGFAERHRSPDGVVHMEIELE